MTGSTRSFVATLAAVLLLAGCQPSSPVEPTPSSSPASPSRAPTPTFSCTPEAGGEETPCSQAEYDEMKAKDKLYAEAEAVFREYFAENIRISRAGGVQEPTDVLLRTTSGSVLENLMEVFKNMAKRGVAARGHDPTLSVERAAGLSREGSIVALQVCADASGWSFYQGDELVSRGRPAEERVYFRRLDGLLKMSFSEGKWVEKCA